MKTKSMRMTAILMVFTFLALVATTHAMDIDDLDSNRRIDWTRAGYQGAIPHISSNLTDVTNWGAAGDGATDDSGALQSAIDNAVPPAVIHLPAGTYRIDSRIVLKNGIVIRGDGHKASVLECRSGDGCISVRGASEGGYLPVPDGAAKDATQIVVADASGFKVGQGGQIRQDDIVSAQADWGRGAVGQMVRIQAVNGNTLTFDPPLHLDFPAHRKPEIRPIRYIEQVGLEDFAIKRIDSGSASSNNIDFRYAANCWVRRVESQWTEKYHLTAGESLYIEIRDSYIHDAESRGSGGYGYGVSLARHATSILVENNIFYDLRHSMIIQLGTSGCVFGYNYSRRNYSDDDGGWAKTHISLHGHYPFMNLFEGNIVAWAGVGDYWGPIGPGNTLFRNRIQGTDRFDGIGDRHGLSMGYIHGPQNIIGNEVTGGTIYTSASLSHPDVHYPDEWDKVLYHGNKEKGVVTWDDAMPDHALPASFYRKARPVFMGDLPWPALGGDLILDQGTIPAKQRFDNNDFIPQSTDSDPGPDPDPGPNPDPDPGPNPDPDPGPNPDPGSNPNPGPEPDPVSPTGDGTGSGCFLGTATI